VAQRVLDATVWPPLVGGCHLSRDTRRAVEDAGLAVERWEPAPMGGGAPDGLIPHVLGFARTPDARP
jgi:hypothetical protein